MLLNRAMGEALERRLGEHWRQLEDLYPRLAYHFARSGLPEKAATHLRLAGDQARRMYAHQQAAAYYDDLVACLDELRRARDAAEARSDLAEELAHNGSTAEALDALARAGDTYRMLGDVESLALVVSHIASAHANRGRVDAGLAELLPIVEGTAHPRPDETGEDGGFSPTVRAWLLATLSHLCFMDGRYEEALRVAELAQDVAQTTGDTALIGRAHLALGVALFVAGRAHDAASTLRLAISCAEAASERELLIESLLMSIWVAQTQGDFASSRALQERALAEAAEFCNPTFFGHACIFVGLLAFYTGDWDQARALAKHSVDAIGQVDASQLSSYPPLGLGILCLVSGERAEAMRHLEDARATAEHSDGEQVLRLIAALLAEDELVRGCGEAACARLIPVLEAGPLQERTRIELQTLRAWGTLLVGQAAEAEALALDAVRSAREQGMGLLLPDALRVRALCAMGRSDWPAATEALEEALALCARMPYPYAEAKARHVYGQLYLAKREPRRAREQFERALSICKARRERMYGAAIEEALLRATKAEDQGPRVTRG
jgi:tetratricopeptide (TPR) repeat protein